MIRVALSGRVARSEGAHEVCDQVGDGENRDEVRQGGGKGLGEEEETRDNVISDMDKYKEEGEVPPSTDDEPEQPTFSQAISR